MTNRDWRNLTEAIRRASRQGPVDHVALSCAAMFGQANPFFDVPRFLDACGASPPKAGE